MYKYLFLLSSVLAAPALAQDADGEIEYATAAPPPMVEEVSTITVTATGLPIDVSQTGQPISIISRDEIESVQGPDLSRVLQRMPGVTATRNGGAGGFTGVRVRGAASEQLLVLIDGVKVNDAASPGGGFDFGNLLAGEIEQIELLRGPNSVAWGADAMGGVMNLTTRAPDGIVASAEYGARDSVYTTLGGGIRGDAFEMGVTGSYYDTDGFSAARSGTEDDGYRQYQVTGRARYRLTDILSIVANGRYADSRLEQDGYPAPTYAFADTADLQDTSEWSGRIGAEYRGDRLSLRAGYALSDTERTYTGQSYGDFPYATKGRTERAEVFGQYALAGPVRLDFGADREWSEFEDSGTTRDASINSGHAMLGIYLPFASVSAGARYDDHSTFGDEWTFGANAAVSIAADLRVRASYGEGFKVPSLYQLYSFYGDTGLNPETSKGYDIGLEKGYRDGPFFAGVSLFRRDSRNLIDFDLVSYSYYNIGKARSEGVEIELGARPSDNLRAGLVYTYVESTDRTPGGVYEGNDLNRRPRHAMTASLDWTAPFAGIALGTDIRMVGDSFDDRGEWTRLDGYQTVDLRGSVPLGTVELFGRVENLFDAGYETVAGYGTAGRSAYVGARLSI
ncbi:TonB-dependent receptor plug domain-containing protein [Croceicoccus sediminis]|uniref:TonB-dependent receptor plug domain-containing protein n=1 Tax=Croceicoccus sediminis TaxID=2571150 RepID=UPI001182A335|nr:TonB-dependent receptor [Croceicoccus sediminis]